MVYVAQTILKMIFQYISLTDASAIVLGDVPDIFSDIFYSPFLLIKYDFRLLVFLILYCHYQLFLNIKRNFVIMCCSVFTETKLNSILGISKSCKVRFFSIIFFSRFSEPENYRKHV